MPELASKTVAVGLVAAINVGERSKAGENHEVQASEQNEGDQRQEDAHSAAHSRVMVLVAGTDPEHLCQGVQWIACLCLLLLSGVLLN